MFDATLAHNFFALAASAFVAFVLRHILGRILAGLVPDWSRLGKMTQRRVRVEMATLPARMIVGFLGFPVVRTAFLPIHMWRSKDTHTCLIACSILAGAYLMDLTVPRSSRLSTLHYGMPLVLLIVLRNCASTGTPADALMGRFVMALLLFNGSVGGMATNGLTFCFHCREVWATSASAEPLLQGYQAYSTFLSILSMTTMAGHYYCAIFMHWWFVEGHDRFGAWVYALYFWALLDLLLEIKFLWWFQTYKSRYEAKVRQRSLRFAGDPVITDTARWRLMTLCGVSGTWLFVMLRLLWRDVRNYGSMWPLTHSLK